MAKTQFFTNLINILPDSRPITSLSIVEDYEKCPKNFKPLHRTFDADHDADLWKENVIFGRRTGRYLCISKSEGVPEYIIEHLKIIGEKETPPQGYSLLSRTYDTEQKAWRKKQLCYKLARKGNVKTAVTEIVLCSKTKLAPDGYTSAGEINGILICYKSETIAPVKRPAPPTPEAKINDIQKQIDQLKCSAEVPTPPPRNRKVPITDLDDEYEFIQPGYQLSPNRPAPEPPRVESYPTGTLYYSTAAEISGVPFQISSNLNKTSVIALPSFDAKSALTKLDYNFALERQILCTTKSSKLNNPFFK